jgi:transcriptional regulator with XRE-family HTH domain
MLSKARFTQILGNNIRKVRLGKGLTQDELSAKCSFYRTYINLVETANRTPSSYSLHRIAKGLGVSPSELYPK